MGVSEAKNCRNCVPFYEVNFMLMLQMAFLRFKN